MAVEIGELPLLRYRDGDEDRYFESPITIMGKIIALDVDAMTIDKGRDAHVELYLEDFEDVLGDGDPDLATSILLDAAQNEDIVTITLSAQKLSYDNDRQRKRSENAAS